MSRRDEAPVAGGEMRALCGQAASWQGSEDVTGLGQEVVARFLAAGLELHSALSIMDAGPAADRCARAIGELDDAIQRVRHLALAAHKRARGEPAPDPAAAGETGPARPR